VGAFVLGAVALIVVVFVVFGSGSLFQPLETYVTYFSGNVKGLKVGSPVLVRGVEIGTVSQIKALFDSQGDLFVEVLYRNRPQAVDDLHRFYRDLPPEESLDLMIEQGLRAQLNSMSLVTGMLYIKLDFFPDTPVELKGLNEDYTEIPSTPTSGELLQERLLHGLEQIERMPLVEITEELHATLQGVQVSLQEINKLAGHFQDIDTRETLAILNRSLDAAEGLITNLNSQLDPITSSFVDTSQAAQDTLKSIEAFMGSLEDSAAEERYELRTMLIELSKANRAIRVLVDHLQRDPRSLVWGKK